MQNFEFAKHMVVEASFKDNGLKKEGESGFTIDGQVLMPRDGQGIIIERTVTLGKPDENLYLSLKMMTFFSYIGKEKSFDVNAAREECLPIADEKMKETVKNVTTAYGMPLTALHA